MPYLYAASKKGEKNIAVRFSEFEDIKTADYFKNIVNWIWIDTINKLPIKKENLSIISKYKSCIVCPERWGRKNDIKIFKKKFEELKFSPNAVMTSQECIDLWE